jgi:hypothetical protein
MGVGRPRGSSSGRDNFGGRVRQGTRRGHHSWELTWRSNTKGKKRVESESGIGECPPDLQLILDRFQEGLAEVGNGKHLGGTTTEGDQQSGQSTVSEANHRKLAEGLVSATKIMSRYERVFRLFKTDGIFVKLSKVPGGAVGAS